MLYREIFPLGDSAFLIYLGREISPAVNDRVFQLDRMIRESGAVGVLETVPGYCSLAVYYDPLVAGMDHMVAFLEEMVRSLPAALSQFGGQVRLVELPVAYGGEYGPDLETVARHCGLTPGEVVKSHCDRPYRVYMLGFMPGFPYLGGLDPRLETPRLAEPRLTVPPGAVGIAGKQTGVYPLASPGGWQIIGRTPVPIYQPRGNPPALLRVGDYIRFVPVNREAYPDLAVQTTAVGFRPRTRMVSRAEVEHFE